MKHVLIICAFTMAVLWITWALREHIRRHR